ncbi:MAG: hypothetical protein OHK0024_32210 [Thalassobaculales bacterium]
MSAKASRDRAAACQGCWQQSRAEAANALIFLTELLPDKGRDGRLGQWEVSTGRVNRPSKEINLSCKNPIQPSLANCRAIA